MKPWVAYSLVRIGIFALAFAVLMLVGVDSWGVACGARAGDPEVFARVAAERAFVTARHPGWTTDPIEEPFAPGRF